MGNQQTVQNHLDFADIATNYVYEIKYSDNRFGEVKLLKQKVTGERIFQKDFTSNSSQEFNSYINRIKDRLPLLHPNILKVLGYNSKKEDLFCADFFKISLFFESFESDLEKEIYKRKESKSYFPETELRCLLDSVISACAYLQKNGVSHGDIRPYNIFITKNKEYKICDSTLFQSVYNPSYFGVLDGLEAQNHYPSPQVFQNYQQKSRNAAYDPFKNDVYGLGATVLAAARLKKINDAYDYDKKIIKQDYIDEALEKLHEHYSESFVEALRLLLTRDEESRPDFIQLDEQIKGYRADLRAHTHLERTLEQQRRSEVMLKRSQQESPVKSAPKQKDTPNNIYYDDDLDKKVRAAVQKSEEKANKSPAKFKNEVIDNCIQTYLKKDPLPQDQPLLYTLSPHLSMQNRFVPTLKIYSQDNREQHEMSISQYQSGSAMRSNFNSTLERPVQHGSYHNDDGYSMGHSSAGYGPRDNQYYQKSY